MNKSDDRVKGSSVYHAAGDPEQEKEWQLPRLTIWEVAEDTANNVPKTGSGADSYGMRELTT